MKHFKIISAVTMIIVLVLSVVGCNSKEDNSDSTNKQTAESKADYIPDETVTLKVFSQLCSYDGIQKGWFSDVMLEKFNVRLDLSYGTDENNIFDEDCDLVISATSTTDDFISAINDGELLELTNDNMTKYMPYVSKHLKDSLLLNDSGKIYGIKTSTAFDDDHSEIFYTWDIIYSYYEELGSPTIEDIDDWTNMLKQMKEKHPTNNAGDETYGLTLFNDWNEGCLFGVQALTTAYYGLDYWQLCFKDWKTGVFYGTLDRLEDGSYGPYLQALQLYNKLYREDLLDPDFETRDYDTAVSMVENGQILVSLQNFMGSIVNDDMFPVIPTEAKQIAYGLGHGFKNRTISIDSSTKYPELCMAIIDYLYTPEGMLTMQYGPKGECWNYDEEGNTYLTETGMKLYLRYDSVMDTYRDGFPMMNISPYNNLATNTDNGEVYNVMYWKNTNPDDVADLSNNIHVDRFMHNQEPYIVTPTYETMDINESDLKDKYTAVSDIIISKSLEAIKASTDEEFDTIVKDMITKANEAGYTECVDFTKEHFIEVE